MFHIAEDLTGTVIMKNLQCSINQINNVADSVFIQVFMCRHNGIYIKTFTNFSRSFVMTDVAVELQAVASIFISSSSAKHQTVNNFNAQTKLAII